MIPGLDAWLTVTPEDVDNAHEARMVRFDVDSGEDENQTACERFYDGQ